MIRFIGDTHDLRAWAELRSGAEFSIHVGDVGFGEGGLPPKVDMHHRFIKGNKDEYKIIQHRDDWMGDYGFIRERNIFFIGGAQSVEPVAGEELSNTSFQTAFYHVLHYKPEIIVSHDCPYRVFGEKNFQGKTFSNIWLDKIFSQYHPKLWVFGHHHVAVDKIIEGTCFVGIAKCRSFEL